MVDRYVRWLVVLLPQNVSVLPLKMASQSLFAFFSKRVILTTVPHEVWNNSKSKPARAFKFSVCNPWSLLTNLNYKELCMLWHFQIVVNFAKKLSAKFAWSHIETDLKKSIQYFNAILVHILAKHVLTASWKFQASSYYQFFFVSHFTWVK